MNLNPPNLEMQDETKSVDTDPQDTDNQPAARKLIEAINIADKLDKEKLDKIGADAKRGYEADKQSRKDWEDASKEWTKLAIQHREQKSYPWPKASNVKYPLLSTAAMQFAARAYPSLVPSDGKIVKSQVVGKDPDGSKANTADRVSTYMSYQLMHEMRGWEEDMDKMLIMLPVVGTMFKKTYFDKLEEKNVSKLVMPMNLVVNYWTRTLEESERISEVIEMSQRIFKERQQAGVFSDIDLGSPKMKEGETKQPALDDTTPYNLIEQHTYLDLDDDGYKEPYIVTFQEESGKVIRITARYDDQSIQTNAQGDLVKITPINYYTKFGFIPNPDGSFYDIGFGVLLGPLNESVNTLINQLVDAGSLANLQSGFIGKGLRIKMGESRFHPGEWKAVNATADDLQKQILPLPVREPSMVLFQLMGSLITSGKELASVAEIFVGKMPGQNTPATTTMASIEQGMKVFTAVYKRIYRSLAEEFCKLYRLNEVYLDPQTYAAIVDVQVGPEDFKYDGHQIVPGADPTAVSQTEKLMKAQGLMELMPLGTLDPLKVTMRILEAQEQANITELIHQETQQTGAPATPPPDPKMIELQMKQDADGHKAQLAMQQQQFSQALDQHSQQFNQAMAAQKQDQDAQYKQMELRLQAVSELHKTRSREAQAQQKMVQSEMQHTQKMHHTAKAAALKQEITRSQANQNKNAKTAK